MKKQKLSPEGLHFIARFAIATVKGADYRSPRMKQAILLLYMMEDCGIAPFWTIPTKLQAMYPRALFSDKLLGVPVCRPPSPEPSPAGGFTEKLRSVFTSKEPLSTNPNWTKLGNHEPSLPRKPPEPS